MAAKAILVGVLVGLALVGLLSFTPLPGYYNVQVTVQSYEVSFIVANDYGISSVGSNVLGQSTVIDWNALGLQLPSLYSIYTMTVCLNPGNHCASKGSSSWFPTVPFVNGQQIFATNQFTVGYVPSGNYSISVNLVSSGSTLASGTGSVSVGG